MAASDQSIQERRKYERYATEAKIYFRVSYNLKTTVKFRVVDKFQEKSCSRKYSAISKNVSAEALCFSCTHKLTKGDFLLLEVYLPSENKPIGMEGEVVWSRITSASHKTKRHFDTGVKLTAVDGLMVKDSIYFDKKHHVTWSVVLESIFGNFRKLAQKKV